MRLRGLSQRLCACYPFVLVVMVISLTHDTASFVTGTELHQFETYMHDSRLHIVSNQYLNVTSACIQEAVGDGRGRGVSPPRWCRRGAIVHFENLIRSGTSTQQSQHPLFTNESLTDLPKVPTCSYSLRSVAMSSGEGMHDSYGTEFDYVISVSVTQRNCSKQGWPARGGSSMRVELLSNHTDATALPSCHLSHTDRSEYVYKCLLDTKPYLSTITNTAKICNALCDLELVVTLDHERFQAFHELEGVKYGMGKVIIRTPIKDLRVPIAENTGCCNTGLASTAVTTQPATSTANMMTTILPAHMQSQVHHIRSTLDQYAAVYFIGSSHMRYLWDAIAYNYYNASAQLQEIPQHHRDEAAGNTWFIASHFSLEIPEVLQHICNTDYMYAPSASTVKKKVVVVLETTTWDLDYLPPRNLVLFPNSSTVVTNAVEAFAHKDHTCAGYHTAVLWLNAPPIPECDQNSANTATTHNRKARNLHANKQSCFDKGHRNNYATRAINEYFIHALGSQKNTESAHDRRKRSSTTQTVAGSWYNTLFRSVPQYKAEPIQGLLRDHAITSTVKLIDAYGLVYPYRNKNVCGLHYICCKHAGKRPIEMQYTPGGIAMLSAVLAALQKTL